MGEGVKSGKLSRAHLVGKSLIKIGTKHSVSKVKRAFLSKERQEAEIKSTHEQIADIIVETLGELKGVSAKVAQQIALAMPFLPAAYIEKMSRTFNTVPPINRALIRKVIHQELHTYPESLFDHFNPKPIGSASLGQVHRATYQDRSIALKVQYPGVAKSIDNDIALLKYALKRFAKGQNIDHLIAEIHQRLKEEVDYYQEAKNTTFFREHPLPQAIVIPEVIPELSTQTIFATTYLDGLTLDAFLATNPDQTTINYYAQLLFDYFFTSLYQLKKIHADPNPGNFLFMKDDQLGLIDFGCVKSFDDDFIHSFSTLHHALFACDDDLQLAKQYHALGMIDKGSDEEMVRFYQEIIKPLDRIYLEVFGEDHYDFKANPNFSKRGFDRVMDVHQKQTHSVHKMSPEYLFLDRTLLGYYAIFEKMGATINTRQAKALIFNHAGARL
jgi:predicted unusual protein kinase regulating ubiquinone biosynthesis (AarF/ABC1/UbiB family)